MPTQLNHGCNAFAPPRRRRATYTLSILLGTTLFGAIMAIPATAQAPNTLPQEHWAYKAMKEFAGKGLVEGYSRDTNLFGSRLVNRYEMASLVVRLLQRANTNPASLNEQQKESIGALLDEFKVELVIMGVDVAQSSAILGGKATPLKPPTPPKETPPTDQKLPSVATIQSDYMKHKLTGYMQFRFDSYLTGGQTLFPASSTVGGPGPGSAQYGFLVRRGRLLYSGDIGIKSEYRIQLDIPSHSAINLRDAFVDVRDAFGKNINVRVGQFTPVFGAELTSSSRVRESPERAMAFADSRFATTLYKGQLPLFNNQDRDVGLSTTWNVDKNTKVTWGILNGEGRDPAGRRNQNRALDTTFRITTSTLRKRLEVGTSLYYGQLALPDVPGSATVVNAYRFLGGWDMKYQSPWGTLFKAEYLYGKFESNPERTAYAKGNHVSGFMLMAAHPINKRTRLVAQYEELDPTLGNLTLGGTTLSRGDLSRKQIHLGALYKVDDALRLRFWYVHSLTPYDATAASGAGRDRLNYFITELQVDF